MVNACADPEFFVRGGGGGGQAQRRENSLDFLCLFLYFFLVQNFPGMRGWGSNYLRGGGGGSKCLFL